MNTSTPINKLIQSFKNTIKNYYTPDDVRSLERDFINDPEYVYTETKNIFSRWNGDERQKLEKELGNNFINIYQRDEIAICFHEAMFCVIRLTSPQEIIFLFKAIKDSLS